MPLLKQIPIVCNFIIKKSFLQNQKGFSEASLCNHLPFKLNQKINWFPNNLLRNVARLPNSINSTPPYFIGIDVDLIPSIDFTNKISNFLERMSHNYEASKIYLIPVFESDSLSVIDNIWTKADLEQMYRNNYVNIFHSWCNVCYNYYDYDKWFSYPGGNISQAYSGTV